MLDHRDCGAGCLYKRRKYVQKLEAPCNSDVERRNTATPSVLIVGGGFAGIAAARALTDASFKELPCSYFFHDERTRLCMSTYLKDNDDPFFPADIISSDLPPSPFWKLMHAQVPVLGSRYQYQANGIDTTISCAENILSNKKYTVFSNSNVAENILSRGRVTLLESQDRIGGRVHTDYSFGFPVELGAHWLHGVCKENPLAAVIGRLGLPLYRTSGDNSVLHEHDMESCALFDMDGNQVPEHLVRKVGGAFERILEELDKIRQEQIGDISILCAISYVFERKPELRLEGIEHKILQWYLSSMGGWFAADVDTISLKCWDHEELLPGGYGLMLHGYLPVINTLAKGLDIRLSHRVAKIMSCQNGVKISVEDGRTFTADAAIVAVPLGVLKSNNIEFEPRLPEWKEAAIADLGVGIENKIILHFENVFWPNVELLGMVAETPYGCSYFLNLHRATGHFVLVYMPVGQLACDIEKMSDERAANFAFTQLKKIFPNASTPIHYLVSRWGTDVNSLGSYSYDAVGKPHDLHEKLRVPVDNLFFAGEATSVDYPGTVHGAYLTGLMAAEDCRMSFFEHHGKFDLSQPVGEDIPVSVPLLISRNSVSRL